MKSWYQIVGTLLIVGFHLSGCQTYRIATTQNSECDVAGITGIFQFFEDKGWGYSGDEYIANIRYLNRSLEAYMVLSIDYSTGSVDKSMLPLPAEVQIDYDHLIKHLRDTVQVLDVHSIRELPFRPIDQTSEQNYFVFSPLILTTSKDLFVMVAQLQKSRDPYRYIFVLRSIDDEYYVEDYYFDDGPVLFIPPEEDLLELDYQRLYGQSE